MTQRKHRKPGDRFGDFPKGYLPNKKRGRGRPPKYRPTPEEQQRRRKKATEDLYQRNHGKFCSENCGCGRSVKTDLKLKPL